MRLESSATKKKENVQAVIPSMWVMRSAASEAIQAAFFYYSRTRSGDNAKMLLEGFNGYLITDAYAGYDKVPDIKRALCWSHARRYLIESIPLDAKGKEIPGSKGAEGREYIDLLFKVEKEINDLPAEEKKRKRQDVSEPILEAFGHGLKRPLPCIPQTRNSPRHLDTVKIRENILKHFSKTDVSR